ncbi:MAG: Translation factor pelota [Alyxoria varia]|nr:MAG: Translation factor pelota [Alyxoria varia]
MKLVKSNINKTLGTGKVTLNAEEPEDLWHLYNLILPGDIVRAPGIRKVTQESGSGATRTETVHVRFSVRVKSVEYDATANIGEGELHARGTICEENPYVRMGAYHTLDLALQRKFDLEKPDTDTDDEGATGGWDIVALETLEAATNATKRAAYWAVVMQEGLANICVITDYQTIVRQRVEVNVPKKRSAGAALGAEAHEKGMGRFYETVMSTLLRHMDFDARAKNMSSKDSQQTNGNQSTNNDIPSLILASPGFYAQNLQKHIQSHAASTHNKDLAAYARNHMIVAHSSSGHVHALNEAIKSPAVAKRLSNTRFARDNAILEDFKELLRRDDGRAWYGHREVERAVYEKEAVGKGGGKLIISDRLFRATNVAERKRWVALVEMAGKKDGGLGAEVRVVSSAHESGKFVDGMGGVAAILTFPVEDLDEDEDNDDADDT